MPHPEPAPERKPVSQVDFDLDALDAGDTYLDFYRTIGASELVPLAEHHDGPHSYYVLHDRSAVWGHPGAPEVLAVHLRRDHADGTFTFDQAPLPLAAMAQSWLIHRGCPPEAIALDPGLGAPPADDATRALEQRLAGDGDRYAMGYSYTSDDPDDMVIVVALHALGEGTLSPFRVMVQEVDADTWTRTLREGGFDSADEAVQWCTARIAGEAGPLPPVRPTTAPFPAGVAKGPAVRQPGRAR
ncbi:hypothetical protein [Streptomyces sp. NPDC002530]